MTHLHGLHGQEQMVERTDDGEVMLKVAMQHGG